MAKRIVGAQSYGQALHAFLETEWDAMGTTRGAWCRSVGLSDSTVFRWTTDSEPDLRTLRQVADSLGRPMPQVLLAIGYIRPDEMENVAIPPRPAPSLAQALNPDTGDTTVSESTRALLLQMWRGVERVASGQTKQARGTHRNEAKTPVTPAPSSSAESRPRR